MQMSNKSWGVIGAVILVVAALAAYFFMGGKSGVFVRKPVEKPVVVNEEKVTIPETKQVIPSQGRAVTDTASVEVPLVPTKESEKVIVPQAVLTVKGAYDKSLSEGKLWQSDAKLSSIKALGTVTLEGKSSAWRIVFVSSKAGTNDGYEIIIEAAEITSKKPLPSSAAGGDLPETWIDSPQAIARLAEIPQFADATISGLNFYYNADGKDWLYAFPTSKGTTTVLAE